MPKRLAVVMDPIERIHYKKDSTLAMLWAAADKGWSLFYITQENLYAENGQARAYACPLKVYRNEQNWFRLGDYSEYAVGEFDVILMRLDPPYDMGYIYTTHLLELAEQQGAWVANNPKILRQVSEKLTINLFPELITDTLVTASQARIKAFYQQHQDIIVKPLDGMGGSGIFRIAPGDKNAGVIIETVTQLGTETVMAQKTIPEITAGDKRILMINGTPVPYALARIPAADENRGNLAAGGTGKGVALSEQDKAICAQVGPWLQANNIGFAGLDVIGNYLTEINVTSPTCIRELNAQYDLDIAADYIDFLASQLAHS